MAARGLDDLVVLVINDRDDADYSDQVEDYQLPVLLDTEEADVFGLWSADFYDLFVIERDGRVAFAQSRTFPIEDHDQLVDVLSDF